MLTSHVIVQETKTVCLRVWALEMYSEFTSQDQDIAKAWILSRKLEDQSPHFLIDWEWRTILRC